MRRRVVIFGMAAVGATALAAAAAGDEPPAQHQRAAGFEQAVEDAGLEDAGSVRGRYVEGTGWQVERAETGADGWTGYAPLDDG